MIGHIQATVPDLPYVPREIEEADNNEILKRIMGDRYFIVNTSDAEFFEALMLILVTDFPGDEEWQYRSRGPRKLLAFRTTASFWNVLRQEGQQFHRNRLATSIHQKLQRRGGVVGVIIVLEE